MSVLFLIKPKYIFNDLSYFILPHPLNPPLQTVLSEITIDVVVWRGGGVLRGGAAPSRCALPFLQVVEYWFAGYAEDNTGRPAYANLRAAPPELWQARATVCKSGWE
jgi:hypothetical protein